MKAGLKFIAAFLIIIGASVLVFPNPMWGDEEESDDTEELHEKGEQIFQEKACVSCHTIGGGKLVGPDLKGVTERREQEWLRKWLKSPETMIYTDPIAKELLKQYLVPMPNQGLTDEDIDALMAYFEHEDSQDESKK
ncbi:MAG TPA: cytochrome c [Thermodesulfobacteriota bacterium]|nr:cytochrome c [Thermodesulfobacteriota bacterium]